MHFKSIYKIIPEHQLVIEKYSGDLYIDDYIKFKEQIVQDKLFRPNFKFFIDFDNVNFKVNENDIETYIKFIDTNLENLGIRFSAILTSTPNQVVITTVYKMLQKNRSQTVEIFSTLEAASTWLRIDKNMLQSLV